MRCTTEISAHPYNQYAGLNFEEQHLEKRRDQQARIESKTRAVVRIKMCLSSGDYSRALDVLRDAAAEFPNDEELSELEKLAQDGAKRKGEADRLITESQELFAQQKSAKAIQLLREAYDLDKNNALARSILANALIEHAQSIIETDWWQAETMANEALVLNPLHPTAKSIENLILARKKSGSVDDWASQTSQLQASGNLSAALSQIAEGLAVHPREPRLLQIQDAIQSDYSTQRRQARRRDLDDLRRTATEVDAASDLAAKKALAERIKAVTTKYSTDGEILSIANALLLRLGQLGVPQKSANSAASSEAAPAIYQAPLPKAPETLLAPSSPPLPKPIPAEKAPAALITPIVARPSIAPSKTVTPVKDTPSVAKPTKVRSTRPEPQLVPPQIASVPGAQAFAIPAKPASSSLPKQSERSNSTTLILAAAAVIVLTTIFFFARTHHAPSVASTTAAAPPTAAPAVPPPADSTSTPTTPEPSPPDSGLSPDTSAEKVTPTNTNNDQPVAEPAPSTGLDSVPNLGTLVVVAGQDNARVFLNGKLQRQLTQAGQLRLPNLELKDYVVKVSKNGFQDSPQQKIRIRAGDQARLAFHLQPLPRLASLTIQGGAPGTAVLIDQSPVGTIQSDGTLSVATINPGDHTVELRKERFKPRQFKKHFDVGAAVSLVAADAALEAVLGDLKITFAPADAKVAIVKGEQLIMVNSGVALNLPAGTYTLTARTADRFTRSSTLEVVAGQSKTLDLSLAPNGMSKWDEPSAWKKEGDSFVRKGGDFVLYGVAPASGTFGFSAMLTKGRLLQWVVNYTDPRNYVLYQMDDSNFYRAVIRNGTKADEIKIPDKSDRKSFREIHIRVSSTEIVNQIKHGNSWKILDRWTQPGVNLGQGKFGLYIPGNDEVAVSNFTHYADLNTR